MSSYQDFTYKCEVWSLSTNLTSLKLLSILLPLSSSCTGLSTKINRFTLLRSPLGNKTSKDQFERREYRRYFFFESYRASKVLAFLDLLSYLGSVKYKIKISRQFK